MFYLAHGPSYKPNVFATFMFNVICNVNYYKKKKKKKTAKKILGPVVQSVVSLTSSLRVISLTVLADSIYNILIFFAEKM